MYLSAMLVPPLARRQEVVQLLTRVGARMEAVTAGAPGRGFGRWPRSATANPAAAGLAPLPPEQMAVQYTRFGYVAPPTAAGLLAALESDARTWSAPMVRIVGRLSTNGSDERLHLGLDGEVDSLRSVFFEITETARRAGFLLDRRSFAPLVPVATLDEDVSDTALQVLVDALEDFAGTPWQATVVTLAKLGFAPAAGSLEPVATFSIGAAPTEGLTEQARG